MRLKLVLQLSLFGLIMAFATVSLIPEKLNGCFGWLFLSTVHLYLPRPRAANTF
jgi:hypothetical protein